MSLTPGQRFGACEILGPLGQGGMGEVYRARDTELLREVALKVLPETVSRDEGRIARFEQEARMLAALNHANIAQVYGLARADGQTAIVMEIVEGETLADRLKRGPISPAEALDIAKQVADALEAAHEQHIIHRDLKPANVKLRPDGTVKVLDFGIAKALDPRVVSGSETPALTTPAMTQAGIVLGTAAYMAPEQARGKPVDQRADIWAFGVLLYEMLTGQPAFAGEDVTITLARVLERDTNFDALPKTVSPAVVHTIRLCLQKDVRRRLRHIGDVRLGLEGVLEAAPPPRASVPAPSVVRRLVAYGATAIGAAVITALLVGDLGSKAEPERVSRFEQSLPAGMAFRRGGRSALSVAPDGRAVVFNTTSGLLLRRLDEIAPTIIPGTEVDLDNPFFSPDSQEVAYWDATGAISKVAIDGRSRPYQLASGITNPFGASWNADGTILIGQDRGIVRMSQDGASVETVIEIGVDESLYGPSLLPGGEWVLFAIGSATDLVDGRIVVESLATHERRQILERGNDARYLATGHIVYARDNTLFAVPFDVATLTVTGPAAALVPEVMRANASQTGVAQYDIADDGTLVYTRNVVNPSANSIVWVGRDGSEEATAIPAGDYTYVRMSPDGRRAVLDDNNGNNGLSIWDFSGGTLSSLALDGRATGFPIWTADGSRIVYWAGSGSWAIESKAVNGIGPIETIAQGAMNVARRPAFFTPDGGAVVFSSNPDPATGSDLGLAAIGDTEVRWLVREPGNQTNAELSPDGRWMAYQSNESGTDQVYVRPFPAVDEDRVLVSTSSGFMPRWAPDGTALYYLAGSVIGFTDRLMVARFAEINGRLSVSERQAAIDPWLYLGTFGTDSRPYDIAPDGQRFVAIKSAAIGVAITQVVFVQNWFAELRRLAPGE